MDRLSDGYLVRTSESLYSVQSMANIRIRSIFDSSNTLVNRLGPSHDSPVLFSTPSFSLAVSHLTVSVLPSCTFQYSLIHFSCVSSHSFSLAPPVLFSTPSFILTVSHLTVSVLPSCTFQYSLIQFNCVSSHSFSLAPPVLFSTPSFSLAVSHLTVSVMTLLYFSVLPHSV